MCVILSRVSTVVVLQAVEEDEHTHSARGNYDHTLKATNTLPYCSAQIVPSIFILKTANRPCFSELIQYSFVLRNLE